MWMNESDRALYKYIAPTAAGRAVGRGYIRPAAGNYGGPAEAARAATTAATLMAPALKQINSSPSCSSASLARVGPRRRQQ
jgi:hypothetical protein